MYDYIEKTREHRAILNSIEWHGGLKSVIESAEMSRIQKMLIQGQEIHLQQCASGIHLRQCASEK
jgi:hypothetical protein